MISYDDIHIWASAACVIEDEIWFVHGKCNILFKYSFPDNKLEIVDFIPGIKVEGVTPVYISMINIGYNIFLIPFWAERIVCYNILDSSFEMIDFPENIDIECEKYVESIVYDDKIYCIPRRPELNMFYIDVVTKETHIISEFKNLLPDNVACIVQHPQMRDNKLYCLLAGINLIYEFDLVNKCREIIKFPNEIKKVSSFVYLDDKFYISCENNNTFYILLKNSLGLDIIDKFEINCNSFWLSSDDEHNIVIESSRDILQIMDTNSKKINIVKLENRTNINTMSSEWGGGCLSTNNLRYYFARKAEAVINILDMSVKYPHMTYEDFKRFREYIIEKSTLMENETDLFDLEDFISKI